LELHKRIKSKQAKLLTPTHLIKRSTGNNSKLTFSHNNVCDFADRTLQLNMTWRRYYVHQEGVQEKGFDLQMLQVLLTGNVFSSPKEVCRKAEITNPGAGAVMPGPGYNKVSNCIH
jgi:hypothetical protein